MKAQEHLLTHDREFLEFFRARFPVYHLSNVFFRDIQYGVMAYLHTKGMRVTYPQSEQLARTLTEKLEREKLFRRIDHQTWAVHHPEYRTPPSKPQAASPAPAAKPAA